MAAPLFSTPFHPYVYQSPEEAVTAFQILGGESQIVQIMLKAQEQVIAKPGTLIYMSASIQMDNNYVPENEAGAWQWFFGKNATSITLTNLGPEDGFVGIATPSPARILPIDLANFSGEILCQPDAFLCSVNDVRVVNNIEQRPRNDDAASDMILKQKLVGQGLAFLAAGGSVAQKILAPGEILVADAGCVIAMSSTINCQMVQSNLTRRGVFGGDNQLMVSLSGPGVVFIQSLPFPRLSQRIARAVTYPSIRDNPRFLMQIAIFFSLVSLVIVSSLILNDD